MQCDDYNDSLCQFEFVRDLSTLNSIDRTNVNRSFLRVFSVCYRLGPTQGENTPFACGRGTSFLVRNIQGKLVLGQSQEGLSCRPIRRDSKHIDAFQKLGRNMNGTQRIFEGTLMFAIAVDSLLHTGDLPFSIRT